MTVAYLPPPVPVRPSVVALRQAMGDVLADDADDPRAAAEVEALLALRSQLEAALLDRLADVDRAGTWSLDGSVTQAAWLRRRGNLSRHEASQQVALSRRLAGHTHVRDALHDGRITRDHAVTCCQALSQLDRDLRELQEPAFVKAAEATDPITLGSELRKRVAALAPLPAEKAAERQRDQRRFSLAKTLGGMWHANGLLDPESGQLLRTALDAQRHTDHTASDTRSPAQRDADALVHLARLALDRGELPATHRVRPHLLVLVPFAQLAGIPEAEVAEFVDGEPLTAPTLQRFACDALLTRLVLGPDGLPLDVGRTQRTVPPHIWLAAVARDRGCVALGCDQPPERCEAHHPQPFSEGGDTSLTNTALVCVGTNGHHAQLHDQGRTVLTKNGRLLGPHGYLDLGPPG